MVTINIEAGCQASKATNNVGYTTKAIAAGGPTLCCPVARDVMAKPALAMASSQKISPVLSENSIRPGWTAPPIRPDTIFGKDRW